MNGVRRRSVLFLGEEEGHQEAILAQAEVTHDVARPLLLTMGVEGAFQHDGHVNVGVVRCLAAGVGAVEVDASEALAVESGKAVVEFAENPLHFLARS